MQPHDRRTLKCLKILKYSKDTKELPAVRRINVTEISSNLENDKLNKSILEIPDRLIDINQTTRIAKKMLSIQVSQNHFLWLKFCFFKITFHFVRSNGIGDQLTMIPVLIICLEIIV